MRIVRGLIFPHKTTDARSGACIVRPACYGMHNVWRQGCAADETSGQARGGVALGCAGSGTA